MPHPKLRLVFAGTPEVAVPSLTRLAESRHDVVAVVTRPDAPQGRKRILTPSAVGEAAETLGLPVITASRLDEAVTERIAALKPDLGVVVAYGGLVREPLLSTPRLGWINLHFSLLPRWRGAAPVQYAVLAGDRETGASVFRLVPELDAGDVFAELHRPIGDEETAGEILRALSLSGSSLLSGVVDDLASGSASLVPQEGLVTLAPKLGREDGRIRFGEDAQEVSARIRAVTPEPGAFTEVAGTVVKVLTARIADGAAPSEPGALMWDGKRLLVGTRSEPIELITVQAAGKRAMDAAAWWRGLPDREGLVAG